LLFTIVPVYALETCPLRSHAAARYLEGDHCAKALLPCPALPWGYGGLHTVRSYYAEQCLRAFGGSKHGNAEASTAMHCQHAPEQTPLCATNPLRVVVVNLVRGC